MGSKGVLVDAGPLVALLSRRDQHHASCLQAARTLQGPFFTCWPVITEAAYLLRDSPEAVSRLLRRVRDKKILLLDLGAEDIDGIESVLARFGDQRFDLADATLMHLAQREGILQAFTIDQRHFSLFRTLDGQSLALLPATSQ